MSETARDPGVMDDGRPKDRGLKAMAMLAAAVLLVAVAARVSVPVPGSPVPQSLQTLAVVLVGAWLGPRSGAIALGLYMAVGAVGAPVFADGAGGLQHLMGPTLGYLVGFALAASLMGWWARQPWGYGVVGFSAGATVAHVVILGLGWTRLGMLAGPIEAWESGVEPFLVGGLAKAVAAALVWVVLRRQVVPLREGPETSRGGTP